MFLLKFLRNIHRNTVREECTQLTLWFFELVSQHSRYFNIQTYKSVPITGTIFLDVVTDLSSDSSLFLHVSKKPANKYDARYVLVRDRNQEILHDRRNAWIRPRYLQVVGTVRASRCGPVRDLRSVSSWFVVAPEWLAMGATKRQGNVILRKRWLLLAEQRPFHVLFAHTRCSLSPSLLLCLPRRFRLVVPAV